MKKTLTILAFFTLTFVFTILYSAEIFSTFSAVTGKGSRENVSCGVIDLISLQNEVNTLKGEIQKKDSEISMLKNKDIQTAGVNPEIDVIIFGLLFSLLSAAISGYIIKQRTANLCKCRVRMLQRMKKQ